MVGSLDVLESIFVIRDSVIIWSAIEKCPDGCGVGVRVSVESAIKRKSLKLTRMLSNNAAQNSSPEGVFTKIPT